MNVTGLILLLVVFGSFSFSRGIYLWRTKKEVQDPQARLRRIRIASALFRWVIGISFVFAIYHLLAFLCGWPFFSQFPPRMAVAPGHVFTLAKEMPGGLLTLALLKTGLDFAAAAALFALFGLYRRGILFSARNVSLIRFQGQYLILGYIVDGAIQSLLRDVNVSMTPVFVGLLIIFVAWIMDEGRKIQEEQELTV
jgi:hypothetical protein